MLTGRYYYGMHSTNNLDDGYLGSGKRLRYSINKYGEKVHKREILEFFDNREKLAEEEARIVNINEIAKEDCMNLVIGGEGGWDNSSTAQSKRGIKGRARMKILRETDPDWVATLSENISKSMRIAHAEGKMRPISENYSWKGKTHSEEAKRKIGKITSKHQSGSGNSQYGTCWVNDGKIGKRIKLSDLDKWLEKGWYKGAKFNRKKNPDVIKTCPNCNNEYTVAYSRRRQTYCSNKCVSESRKNKS